MYNVYDIVLIGANKEEVNNRFGWSMATEGKGPKISRSKTEYTNYGFGGIGQLIGGISWMIRINNDVHSFKYLELFVRNFGSFDEYVKNIGLSAVRSSWNKPYFSSFFLGYFMRQVQRIVCGGER